MQIVSSMRNKIAAGLTVVALGALAALAAGSNTGHKSQNVAALQPRIRTQVIRRTIHVNRHPKKDIRPGGSPRPGSKAAKTAAAALAAKNGGVRRGLRSSGGGSSSSFGSSSSGTSSAVSTRSSGGGGGGGSHSSGGGGTSHTVRTHASGGGGGGSNSTGGGGGTSHPVTTHTSGGGGGGEHESEHGDGGGGDNERPPKRPGRPSSGAVIVISTAVFLALFALLAFRLRTGHDPALGGGASAAVQRPVIIRKIIRRRVITTVPGAGASDRARQTRWARSSPLPSSLRHRRRRPR